MLIARDARLEGVVEVLSSGDGERVERGRVKEEDTVAVLGGL